MSAQTHLLAAAWAECLADPDEFTVAGRFSVTCAMRTLIAWYPDMTRREWLAAAPGLGIHPTTARIQFNRSRAISAEMDATINPDGSLAEA